MISLGMGIQPNRANKVFQETSGKEKRNEKDPILFVVLLYLIWMLSLGMKSRTATAIF